MEYIAILVAAAALGFGLVFSMRGEIVRQGQVGLLYRNGQFEKEVGPGKFSWFDPLRMTAFECVTVVPVTSVSTQHEVMTKDKFAFRLMLVPIYMVTEPRAFVEGQPKDHLEFNLNGVSGTDFFHFNSIVTAEVLKVVGGRELDEFLDNPQSCLTEATKSLAGKLPGASIQEILLTAVQLPPEIRKMFTEVERAKRSAEASLERARGEQASLRALANAARNLNGNPELAQLRVLQVMEQTSGQKTFVLGDSGLAKTAD